MENQSKEALVKKGLCVRPSYFTKEQCVDVVKMYEQEANFHKKIVMARYRFGMGEYKYLKHPLPPIIQKTSENLYYELAPIAFGEI